MHAVPADPLDTRLVLDLRDVTVMDGTAMSVIAEAARCFAEVELRGPSPQNRQVLDLVGLDKVVRITD